MAQRKPVQGLMADSLTSLRTALRAFAKQRAWDKFHTPKNLAVSLNVEAAELLENFQWLTDQQSSRLKEADLRKVEEELADVLLYLIRLADKLDIDLAMAARNKIKLNAKRYPVSKSKGRSTKYTDL